MESNPYHPPEIPAIPAKPAANNTHGAKLRLLGVYLLLIALGGGLLMLGVRMVPRDWAYGLLALYIAGCLLGIRRFGRAWATS